MGDRGSCDSLKGTVRQGVVFLSQHLNFPKFQPGMWRAKQSVMTHSHGFLATQLRFLAHPHIPHVHGRPRSDEAGILS